MHIPLASDAELATTPIQHSTIQPIRVIPSVLSAVIHNIGQHIRDTTISIGVGIVEQNGQFRYFDHSILLKSVTLIPYGTSIRYGKGYHGMVALPYPSELASMETSPKKASTREGISIVSPRMTP